MTNGGKLLIDPPAGSTASLEVKTLNRGTFAEGGTASVAQLTGDGTIHALAGATFALDGRQTLTSNLFTNLILGPGTIASPIHQNGTVQGPVLLDGAWTMTDKSSAAVAIETTASHAITLGVGATLDGTLAITMPTGFAPSTGSTYTLLKTSKGSIAPITGVFTAVIGLASVTQPYQLVYTPSRVYLQF